MASKKPANAEAKKSTENSGKVDGRKQNKGRVENLTPFPKGVSGNPGGRPKSELLSDAYRKYLALPPNPKFVALLSDWGEVPETNAELIAARAVLDAASGAGDARREIRAATEGDKLELLGKDGAELVFRIVYDTKILDGIDDSPAPTAPETS